MQLHGSLSEPGLAGFAAGLGTRGFRAAISIIIIEIGTVPDRRVAPYFRDSIIFGSNKRRVSIEKPMKTLRGPGRLRTNADAAPWRRASPVGVDGKWFTSELLGRPLCRELWGDWPINFKSDCSPICAQDIAWSPQSGHTRAKPVAGKHSCRLLVVDDDKTAAESLAKLLGLWGHEVLVCGSGPQAVQTALTCRPDAALIDLALPGMDGFQLARVVREHAELEEMVLIAVTGLGDQRHRHQASQAGFARHLLKPLIHEELQEILEALA